MKEFARDYFDYLAGLLHSIDTEKVQAFVDELESARQNQNSVFFAGNGGSAATAAHMVNDFGIDTTGMTEGIPPLRAISIVDNVPVLTAISNDRGYERVFTDQLRSLYQTGDKLVVISASGNSPNVVAAAEWVKARGGRVIALVGFDGGRLKDIADIVLHVRTQKGEYGPVEDLHMVVDHVIYSWFRCKAQDEAPIDRFKTK